MTDKHLFLFKCVSVRCICYCYIIYTRQINEEIQMPRTKVVFKSMTGSKPSMSFVNLFLLQRRKRCGVMCILLMLIYFLFTCIPVKCKTDDVQKFIRDKSMNGYKCKEEKVIFKRNMRKILCAGMCLNHRTCLGISYDPDEHQCTGCASLIGVNDVTQDRSTFYKREVEHVYIGCFDDSSRILGTNKITSSSMTTEVCLSHCVSEANKYAMTEYANECFCGNNDDFADAKVPETDCSYTCGGNSSQTCGGYWRGSLYHTGL